jgi:hypothetical protein
MRTLLLFLFYGALAILMYCAETIRWIISASRTALFREKTDELLIVGLPEQYSRNFSEQLHSKAKQSNEGAL